METMKITVSDNLSVDVRPNAEHEYLMTTNEVARGYGVSGGAIRMQMDRNAAEIVEGKHFIKGITIRDTLCNDYKSIQPHQVFWTKRGIVRLGFFIKSARARMFRDWAEDLIITTSEIASNRPKREYCKRAVVAGDVRTLEMLWLIDEALWGISRKDLALELGVSRQTIHGVLTGRVRSGKVLSALYRKALENKKRLLFNPYNNVDKVIYELSK